MVCKSCGKTIAESYGGKCQGCYNYFRKGGTVHKLPPPGTIERDQDGRVICHICGRSYRRLGSHVKESHSMTIDEYKECYGLCRRSKTTEPSYSERMKLSAYVHGMDKRLLVVGMDTRIQPGDKSRRMGKTARLQECIDKSNRLRKQEENHEYHHC